MKKITFIALTVLAVLFTSCTGGTLNAPVIEKSVSAKTLTSDLGFQEDEKLLLVHLDDLGMHKDMDKAALEVFEAGIIKTGSIMAPTPNFDWMVNKVKNRDLDVGIHITLTNEWQEKLPWSALLPKEEVPSLYNEQGYLWKDTAALLENATLEDVEKEMRAQIELALAKGLELTHMDSHMGCYYNDKFFPTAFKLALEYNIPLAAGEPWLPYFEMLGIDIGNNIILTTIDGIWSVEGEEENPQLRVDAIRNYIANLGPGVHYIYTHPFDVTKKLGEIINDAPIRQGDFNFWTSHETFDYIQSIGFDTIGYREIYQLQQQR